MIKRVGIVLGILAACCVYAYLSYFVTKLICPPGSYLDKLNGLAFNTFAFGVLGLFLIPPISAFLLGIITMIKWVGFGDSVGKNIDEDVVEGQKQLDEEFPGMDKLNEILKER
ncbi:MAG TPA: hypothetical protein ENH85_12050 [Candidatus Scalindua sp.]|nr:hypothetical protein [Candidatus Scalindua sp.]